MDILGTIAGLVIFFIALAGLFHLMKGKGRVLTLSSWSDMEKQFGTSDKLPANYLTTSAIVGWGRYMDTFKVALTGEGAYLDTPSIIKFGSKALFIPYHEFTLPDSNQTVSWGFRTFTQFLVRGQSICLSHDVAQEILSRKKQTSIQSIPPSL